MAMIVMLGQGLSSVGMITDLSYADVERLHRSEAISLDEALEGVRFVHSLTPDSII